MEASQTESRSSSSPPTSPLSFLSESPSPPSPFDPDAAKRYPSPITSSAPSGSVSPIKLAEMMEGICERERADGPPPTKRRRITTPRTPRRPRSTEYIQVENLDDRQEEELERLTAALRKKKRIVVIAGAGISVTAGIPDFRSSNGLFATGRTQYKVKASGKHLFDASVYKHDSSTHSFHNMVRELAEMTSRAPPTAFHHMLASIAKEGRLMRLYTQNVDCIDTNMPPLATAVPLNQKGPWPTTIQLHGSLGHMVCSKCGDLKPLDPQQFDQTEAPLCQECKVHDEVRTHHAGKRSHGIGRLRPRMVLYNEYNPDEDAIGMVSKADLRRVPDAVVVVGTSLKIPGVRRLVKEMCQVTRSRRDGVTAWINIDPEPQGNEFKDCWDFVVRGECDLVANLVALPHWDEQDIGDSYMVSGDEEKEKRRTLSIDRGRVEVVLPSSKTMDDDKSSNASPLARKFKVAEDIQGGIPTPSASPQPRSSLPSGRHSLPTCRKSTKTSATSAPRQTKLAFGAVGAPSSPCSEPAKAAPAAAKVTKPKGSKPSKKRKKDPEPVSRSLTNAFKATKSVASSVKAAGKKPDDVPLPQAAMPSPKPVFPNLTANGLPSLRPPVPVARTTPHVIPKSEAKVCDDNGPPRSPVSPASPPLPKLEGPGSLAGEPLPLVVPKQEPGIDSDPISELTLFTSSSPPLSSPRELGTPDQSTLVRETISPTSKPRDLARFID